MRVGVYFGGYSPESGGGHTFEKDILDALVQLSLESQHEFVIYFLDPATKLEEIVRDFSKSKIRVHDLLKLDAPENSKSQPVNAPGLFRKRRKFSQQVVLPELVDRLQLAVEKMGTQIMWFPTPLSLPVYIPYIATVWDLQHRLQSWFPEVGSRQEWPAREAYYSDMLKRATRIIACNQAGRDEIKLFYQIPDENIRILPHPAPAIESRLGAEAIQAVLQKYGLTPGFLFYPAQFWAHKNHVNLLIALKILKDKYKYQIPLVLVGSDKGNEAYVRKYVNNLGLEEQVHFLGFVPRDELLALYQAAFALVYVTFFGPENLPPLEAFALDCPVIASSVSGAKEQFGDAAILVEPHAPDVIAEAVMNLLESPSQRQTLIEHGRQRASQWTSKEFVRGVFAILDDFESIRRCWE
ncbi:MAG: glycosyltransferase family 4 protein [Chloroflexota bacterium]